MGVVSAMRVIISSVCLFSANLLCVAIIGFTHIQDYLSAVIYIVPILIDIVAVFVFYKSKPKQINISFVILMALFVVFAIVMGFVIYISGSFVSSMIAVCTFIVIFDIVPLLLVLLVYNFWRITSREDRR